MAVTRDRRFGTSRHSATMMLINAPIHHFGYSNGFRQMFDGIAQASAEWDGTDHVRYLA